MRYPNEDYSRSASENRAEAAYDLYYALKDLINAITNNDTTDGNEFGPDWDAALDKARWAIRKADGLEG
jgi:hypothetical protein